MILVKNNWNFGPFVIKTYESFYYRNKAAQKENKKTWFKYIDHIQVLDHDGIIINGSAGKKRMIGYNVYQAIRKYNQLAREGK